MHFHFYISSDLHKQFTEIIDSLQEESPLEIEDMFLEGFRMGARFIIDIYQDSSSKVDVK